ncbi:hypothetical protein CVT26_012043 [Gymnopilus dilepis]|uniref:Transmembrane protein n=1 Tax=Gymnopilus dilepis TaxID=231916 RepID=A0A409VYC2_9AGAR|nr:hypothetical protein CVT26_012043 [Gymnopilus dilepis]
MSTTTVTVDDHDAPLVYSGTWLSFHSDEEYMGASTWTSTAGSTATLTFTGTSISVYGTVGILGVNGTIDRSESSYAIDNETVHEWYFASPKQQLQFQTNMWGRDDMPMGQHTLKITNVKGSPYLDYFKVTTPGSAKDVVGSATISSTSTSAISTTASSTATEAISSGAIRHKSAAPVIAGAVVASLALLAICLGVCICSSRRRCSPFFYRKKQRERVDAFPPTPSSEMSEPLRNPGPEAVSPFDTSDRSRATILSTMTSLRKSLMIPANISGSSSGSSRASKAAPYNARRSVDSQEHDPPPSYSIA